MVGCRSCRYSSLLEAEPLIGRARDRLNWEYCIVFASPKIWLSVSISTCETYFIHQNYQIKAFKEAVAVLQSLRLSRDFDSNPFWIAPPKAKRSSPPNSANYYQAGRLFDQSRVMELGLIPSPTENMATMFPLTKWAFSIGGLIY